MKKALSFTFGILLIGTYVFAQVPKTIMVEHFTNTRCGICASKNPSLYPNIDQHSGTLHLSVHPSSPYNTCVLNLHNVSENDSRTNYYGVYGGTPDLVVQGVVLSPSVSYSDTTIFDPYQGATSPASIDISETRYSTDSIEVRVKVTTEATHSLGTLRLFVALVEDTIFYNSPNGETEHHDVFRKALTAAAGDAVTLPANVGDSIVFTATHAAHMDWEFSRIKTVVILQEETSKATVQAAEKTSGVTSPPSMGLTELGAKNYKVYPNPVADQLTIKSINFGVATARLISLTGQVVVTQSFQKSLELDVQTITPGTYILQIEDSAGVEQTKVVVE